MVNDFLRRASPGGSLYAALGGNVSLPEPLGALVGALHAANQALWRAEERVRDRALADVEVVALKRAIDRSNLERHAAVAALDRWVDAATPAQRPFDDPTAFLLSESFGQLVDRLSVLALRHEALRADAVTRRDAVAERVRRVVRCLDALVEALARGAATRQSFDEDKTYGA